MTPRSALAEIEARGRAIRAFVDRVAERGGVAVSEIEDLVVLRARWLIEKAVDRTRRGSR
jgi:hypothetical protein